MRIVSHSKIPLDPTRCHGVYAVYRVPTGVCEANTNHGVCDLFARVQQPPPSRPSSSAPAPRPAPAPRGTASATAATTTPTRPSASPRASSAPWLGCLWAAAARLTSPPTRAAAWPSMTAPSSMSAASSTRRCRLSTLPLPLLAPAVVSLFWTHTHLLPSAFLVQGYRDGRNSLAFRQVRLPRLSCSHTYLVPT